MSIFNRFTQKVSVFQGISLPEEEVFLAGYTALINALELNVPLPEQLFAISHKSTKYQKHLWVMMPFRYEPTHTLLGHLKFALKYEGLDLYVLKAIFNVVPEEEIIRIIKQEPTGSYTRRIWFLYEWLLQKELNVPVAPKCARVSVLDDKLQYPGTNHLSKRHNLYNNLPGVVDFCPLVRKTKLLINFESKALDAVANNLIASTSDPNLIKRASAFLQLQDSKASYAIEGEIPAHDRAQHWANIIAKAGTNELTMEEFYDLQAAVIKDFRFVHYGYRQEGGFIGTHDRLTQMPIPVHISSRPEDIDNLMDGLIATNKILRHSNLDPIIAAAMVAFGFVFIHPYEDGNGRVHRYLIHHVLAEMNFSVKGLVFPISACLLEEVELYREFLEKFSKSRLKFIKWLPTEKNNVNVLNETIDLYRYFDATVHAEFLYACVEKTIEKMLPDEINYLHMHDKMEQYIKNQFDIPDRIIDLLIIFLKQGNGVLSKRARQKEFHAFSSDEVVMIEEYYKKIQKEHGLG